MMRNNICYLSSKMAPARNGRKSHLIYLTKDKERVVISKKLLMALITIIAVLMLIILFRDRSMETTYAKQPQNKYYKSIMIERGDSLWSIAKENIDYDYYKSINEYIQDIKRMNSLKSDKLISGRNIIIPYY